jgi:hypothetical protein
MKNVLIAGIKVSATGATVELSAFEGSIALTRAELARLVGEVAIGTWRATIEAQQAAIAELEQRA